MRFRHTMPPKYFRKAVLHCLQQFFRYHDEKRFMGALCLFCHRFELPMPKVEWFEYLDWYKTAGMVHANGEMHLVHPENWKNGRKMHTEREWILTVLHEFAHYLCWPWTEKQADAYAEQFIEGI